MKKIIFTDKAPTPIGPYSQAVLAGNMLYVSGQVPINPATGELMMNSIEDQTQQVMQNLQAVLAAADMTFDNVIKSSIFITDMNDFSKINGVYGTYFAEGNAPARETVQVSALPRNVNVEISVIAIR
ncbi:MAG TPA: RidA family protein [Flavobacterium sp.]|nr:RidA family protein [Flavobacterium sp.]